MTPAQIINLEQQLRELGRFVAAVFPDTTPRRVITTRLREISDSIAALTTAEDEPTETACVTCGIEFTGEPEQTECDRCAGESAAEFRNAAADARHEAARERQGE